MLDEEYQFLTELSTCPDDQDRRLVYADWLEEHGDRRAEFVRLEVELESRFREPVASKLADRLSRLAKEIRSASWEREVTKGRASELFLHARNHPAKRKRAHRRRNRRP